MYVQDINEHAYIQRYFHTYLVMLNMKHSSTARIIIEQHGRLLRTFISV
jgi:hypothetical protein